MRVLLSFTGFHDPYSKSLVGEEDQPGPVLSVLGGIHYDRVVLFSTPRTAGHSELTEAAIHTGNANLQVELIHLNLDDPTDYRAILSALRHHGREIRERFPGAEIHIATASGTPQMHACWLLLTASQELPARLLHIRPPQFITDGRPAISTIEVTGADFPVIRAASPVLSDEYSDDSAPPGDLNAALREVGLIAHHPLTIDCVQQAAAVAPYSLPALILGETGSGKELIARLIHRLSQRPVTKFVAVNCGAIPPDLVESTLFGHKKGSFTGAVSDLTGKFELADGGTLFLDEIGDLPTAAQVKILRVLEESVVEPVGSNQRRPVNVRIVAATHRNLADQIQEGRFRSDLYYRLNTAIIRLPPLRDRRTEIPVLAVGLLDGINQGIKRHRRIAPEALRKLESYNWPGNVRELRNVLQRAVVNTGSRSLIDAADVVFDVSVGRVSASPGLPEPGDGFQLEKYLGKVRHDLLVRALEISGGNQSEAARLLGVSAQAVSSFQKKRTEQKNLPVVE